MNWHLFFLIGLTVSCSAAHSGVQANKIWAEALARMPLRAATTQLSGTNCVEVMLSALQSNEVVKALVFMPGATDEFYMFHRAKADLTNAAPTLLDAIAALTNQSLIRASFKSPLLLLHTSEDGLEPGIVIGNATTAAKLSRERMVPRLLFNDRDWDTVQPVLKRSLKVDVRPWRHSPDSWHFCRHSFAGWNLTGFEALEATALSGKSRFTLRSKQVIFEPDARIQNVPTAHVEVARPAAMNK